MAKGHLNQAAVPVLLFKPTPQQEDLRYMICFPKALLARSLPLLVQIGREATLFNTSALIEKAIKELKIQT